MSQEIKIGYVDGLPEAVKRKLGLGITRSMILHHEGEEILVKATQEIEDVIISLTLIKGEKARTISLTETELHRILLMARDIRRISDQGNKNNSEESLNSD